MKRLVIFFLTSLIALGSLAACGSAQPPTPAENSTTTAEAPTGELEASTAEFTISPTESAARFELEEDLRSAMTGWALGARITVVGTADQISGTFQLDPTNPADAQFNPIQIDARTFYTDEFMRTRAIQNRILHTDQYPFITFTPTTIEGLPDSTQIGQSVTFTIIGTLTIQDQTHEETFEVTAVFDSPTQISGTATTTIPREKYNLTIPNVANVTFVEEEVELYLDFVARST